jgi:type VII secretion integral membrane protein EccD
MSQSAVAAGSLVRISIVSEDRRLDIGIPAQVPLIELLPGFARSLGVLDPTLTHGGYALHRADGSTLDPARGCAAQGVRDGELLTLVRGGLLVEPRVYDDVVEAVIDATGEQHGEWTPRDNARTALAVSLTFLALCAILLIAVGPALGIGALVAGGGTIVLIATAAVLSRVEQPEAGHALGLAGALFGGIAGYLLVPASTPWGWPLAAAGLGAVVVGGLALALTQQKPEVHLIPIAFGGVVGITSTIAGLFAPGSAAPYAIMIAVAAALSNGLPWLALSSTRIRIISPQSDQEFFTDPGPIDAKDIKRRYGSGQRVLISLRVALGLVVLAGTPIVAASNVFGALLCTLAFVGMMFQSRQTAARLGVLVLMTIGAIGLAATGLTIAATQVDLRGVLLVIVLSVAALLVMLALLSPRARLGLARLSDTAEVIALALLLPLGVASTGLVF